MDFLILGPLDVLVDGTPAPLGGAKQRTVLANLVVEADRVVPYEVLIDRVWGERPPPRAANALQVYVSQLRRAFHAAGAEPAPIETRKQGYLLLLEGHTLDARRFESLVAEARSADVRSRPPLLRRALALWRGPAFLDFRYEEFAASATARLEELKLVATEELTAAELELGFGAELVPELEALVAEHPYREKLHGHLMLALYRAGRQADALEAYHRARVALDETLGIEPGPELNAVQRAILAHDPALQAQRTADAPAPEIRRTVSLACIRVTPLDSTDPEAQSGPVQARERVANAVALHGARVEQLPGGVLAAAYSLDAYGDAAARALRAALDAVAAGRSSGTVETAAVIVTGDCVSVAGQPSLPSALGELLNRAVAHVGAAGSGDVLADGATRALAPANVVPGAGDLAVVVSVDEPGAALQTPFVGHDAEIDRLADAAARAADGRGSFIFVTGDAGIGKTRLLRELLEHEHDRLRPLWIEVSDAEVVRPVARGLLGLLGGVAGRAAGVAAAALGDHGNATPEELSWALRELLAQAADEAPTLVAIDAAGPLDDANLAAIADLGRAAHGHRLLLVATARRGSEVAEADETISLGPLGALESAAVLEWLLPAETDGRGAHERVADLSDGNPFVLEQLAAAARSRVDLDALPAGARAVASSRLDRLDQDARAMVEILAAYAEPAELSDIARLMEADPDLVARTAAELERADVVARTGTVLAVPHELIRAAAYAAATKERRLLWHERLYRLHTGFVTHKEAAARHLGTACLLARELGRELTAPSSAEAGTLIAEAGRGALDRGDVQVARDLLRTAALIRVNAEVLLDLASACELADRSGEAVLALARIEELEVDRMLEARFVLRRLLLEAKASAEIAPALVDAAALALAAAVEAGDGAARYEALRALAAAQGARGWADAEADALAEALDLLSSDGNRSARAEVIALLAGALADGTAVVSTALERCAALRDSGDGHPLVLAGVESALAELHALAGDGRSGREAIARARDAAARFGWKQLRAQVALRAARAARVLQDDGLAKDVLEEVLVAARISDGACATELARLDAERATDTALDWLRLARLAPPANLDVVVGERMATAVVARSQGLPHDAVAAARAAVEALAGTTRPALTADAYGVLAVVLDAAGHPESATDARAAATAALRLKGA